MTASRYLSFYISKCLHIKSAVIVSKLVEIVVLQAEVCTCVAVFKQTVIIPAPGGVARLYWTDDSQRERSKENVKVPT